MHSVKINASWCKGNTQVFGAYVSSSNLLEATMIEILRKEGWNLNPNDKVVNNIFKMIERNNGECPCSNNSTDKKCPCSDYREKDVCHCGLYLKLGK